MRRWLAAALLLVAALSGCSEGEAQRAVDDAQSEVSRAVDNVELPEVDWEKHGADVRRRLDRLAKEADCSGLRDELAKVEKNDTELTRYIKAQLRRIEC